VREGYLFDRMDRMFRINIRFIPLILSKITLFAWMPAFAPAARRRAF
jgi:hypothetical protein